VKDLAAKIGVKAAYEALNLPRSRAYQPPKVARQEREKPAHALSDAERAEVRAVLNSERFMDKAPRQVYAMKVSITVTGVPCIGFSVSMMKSMNAVSCGSIRFT
jgi:hypothetical protein